MTNLYITDRLIWSLFKKHASSLLYNEDGKMKIMKMAYLFTTHPYVELIDVDKVEAECAGIKSNCTIKRTKDPLPEIFKGYWGPLIRAITSLDGETEVLPTSPSQYVRKTSSPAFKYNKTKYYWLLNGYAYFPNIEWDAVKIDAAFVDENVCGEIDTCSYPHDKQLFVPEYILSAIQGLVLQDIGVPMQVQKDQEQDKHKAI